MKQDNNDVECGSGSGTSSFSKTDPPGLDPVTVPDESESMPEYDSTPAPSQRVLDSYEYLLEIALNNTGRHAFGVVAIEVWMLDKSDDMLKCANGATWRDPVFETEETSSLLALLENPAADGYLPPSPLMSGVGVAGTLFAEERGNLSGTTNWRDLQQLAFDQDRIPDERLQVLAKVFGLAKGLYFENGITENMGLIIYYARRTADRKKLSFSANEIYLCASAHMLGSIVAWEKPRAESIKDINATVNKARESWRRGAFKIKLMVNISKLAVDEDHRSRKSSVLRTTLRSSMVVVDKYVTKFKGGEFTVPPSMKWSESLFAFLGCLSSLLTISLINEYIRQTSQGDHFIILAPLGALVTCHYGLTTAPASQPRNGILGMGLSSVAAISSTYIPVSILPIWLRAAVVPAICISLTLKLGLVHPPAGAIAVLFSVKDNPDWFGFMFLLLGYAVANLYAVLFINLHEGAFFPMYWGFKEIFIPRKLCAQKET